MSVTRSQFEEELEKLRDMLLAMGSEADRAVADAMRALEERDLQIAESVLDLDDRIDEMDLHIEAECMRIIALQHPLARDLRLVGTALKIITDLERIGDHAVDIAKVARKFSRTTQEKALADLPRMAASVRRMLKTALDAFVRHDLGLVDQVIAGDDEVDELFHLVREDLHAAMQKDANVIVEASYLLFVAHYLERIADHAVNIAERVYFVETGQLSQLAKSHKTGT